MPAPDVDPHPDHDAADPLAELVGSGQLVPCLDGMDRPAIELDQAASTQAHPDAVARVGGLRIRILFRDDISAAAGLSEVVPRAAAGPSAGKVPSRRSVRGT